MAQTSSESFLLRYRLDRPVGGSGVSAVDVLIVTLTDDTGVQGLGFSYVIGGGGEAVLAAARQQLARHAAGALPPPSALWRRVAASFNRTGLGPNLVALAAFDVAAWDLTARRRGVPLVEALGGETRPVPVYGSGGFTAGQDPVAAAEVAAMAAGRGLRGVKPRARGERADSRLLEAVRAAIPDQVELMVDANERCDLASARRLLETAGGLGALFVEEPLPSVQLDGYRALARGGAPVATGEHLQGRGAFLPYLTERLAAVLQPDLAMAGGLTPVLEVCALADAFGIAVSPHFLPGLFVHLAGAAPALAWLEEFQLIEPLFDGWPLPVAGELRAPATPGHGLALAPEARARYEAV